MKKPEPFRLCENIYLKPHGHGQISVLIPGHDEYVYDFPLTKDFAQWAIEFFRWHTQTYETMVRNTRTLPNDLSVDEIGC